MIWVRLNKQYSASLHGTRAKDAAKCAASR